MMTHQEAAGCCEISRVPSFASLSFSSQPRQEGIGTGGVQMTLRLLLDPRPLGVSGFQHSLSVETPELKPLKVAKNGRGVGLP
jgi:hypothetical protein